MSTYYHPVAVEPTYREYLKAHLDALQLAHAAGREAAISAEMLITHIYDYTTDWNSENDYADALFWTLVDRLKASIPLFQIELREVGLGFAEKPFVEVAIVEGHIVPYGDMVRLDLVDVSALTAVAAVLTEKMDVVSAELARTKSELDQLAAREMRVFYYVAIVLIILVILLPAWAAAFEQWGASGTVFAYLVACRVGIMLYEGMP